MAVTGAIGQAGVLAPERVFTNTSAGAEIDRNEFFRILIAQLKSQDPFNPMDQSEFLGQITSLESLRSMEALRNSLESVVRSQDFSAAGSLIGKRVVGVSDSGERVAGLVDRVVLLNGEVRLMVGDETVPLSKLLMVEDPFAFGSGLDD